MNYGSHDAPGGGTVEVQSSDITVKIGYLLALLLVCLLGIKNNGVVTEVSDRLPPHRKPAEETGNGPQLICALCCSAVGGFTGRRLAGC